jgi:hypothetical protein
MFPISHVYMLNRLVNKKFDRNLDERDSLQIMGVWLLDAIVSPGLRQSLKGVLDVQKYFHTMQYSAEIPLQAGMLVHVLCDNLANCGTFDFLPKKECTGGFVGKRAGLVYVPAEVKAKDEEEFRRRIVQGGLDMLIVRKAKDEIKDYFSYDTKLFKERQMYEDVYAAFAKLIAARNEKEKLTCIDEAFFNTLHSACTEHLAGAIDRYSSGFEYTACDWRRAGAARDSAGEEYCKKVSVVDLIQSNFSILQGWESDIDTACHQILKSRPDVLGLF